MENLPSSFFKTSLIPEFSVDPGPTFGAIVSAPSHFPCWCIKPSEISFDMEIFDKLKQNEYEFLNQGKQLWIVRFEFEENYEIEDCYQPFFFLLTEPTISRPTSEQLYELEGWYGSINIALNSVISKRSKESINE